MNWRTLTGPSAPDDAANGGGEIQMFERLQVTETKRRGRDGARPGAPDTRQTVVGRGRTNDASKARGQSGPSPGAVAVCGRRSENHEPIQFTPCVDHGIERSGYGRLGLTAVFGGVKRISVPNGFEPVFWP